MFRCAFFESDITPPLYHNMPGYFSERLAEDVLDKLYAKAFVCCGSNGVKTAMVAIDANMIPEEIVVAAKKRIADHTDIPTENISVSATHNHNGGPTVSWGKLVRQEDSYMAFVADKAADAVIVANRHLRPARIGYGCGRVDDISFHRIYEMKNGTLQTNPGVHNPDVVRPAGPIDPDVTVLRVDDAETGKPLGSVTNFACHLDCVDRMAYSGDYAAALSDELKDAYGHRFVSVFFVGTCGNINHFDVFGGKHTAPDYYRYMGKRLGDEVKRVFDSCEYSQDDTADTFRTVLTIPKRRVPESEIPELKRITETVTLHEHEVIGSQSDPDQLKAVFAYDLLNYIKTQDEDKEVPVQFVRLGDNAFYELPGEVFVQFGQKIKRESPFRHNFILTNSNGLYGYLPLRELFMPTVYESKLGCTSYLDPEAGYRVTDAALEMAKEAFSRGKTGHGPEGK